MKLLLIEDAREDLDAFMTTLTRWNEEHSDASKIDLIEKHTFAEAMAFLHSYDFVGIDGIILDLSLNRKGDAGAAIIEELSKMKRRVPVYIFTATPDAITFPYVLDKKKKGECGYDEVFKMFELSWQIGLSRILGNTGKLEECLKQIFDHGIVPNFRFWSEYAKLSGSEGAERALARHVALQLHDMLDGDNDKFAPHEFYMTNLEKSRKFVKAGDLLKQSSKYYVVMTPPCDLVVRESTKKPKSDTILLGSLEDAQPLLSVIEKCTTKRMKKEGKSDDEIKEIVSENIKSVKTNRYCLYYHYAPCALGLPEMILDFRKLTVVSHSSIEKAYSQVGLRISPTFFRDILSRFSAYYGRQGQPELDVS